MHIYTEIEWCLCFMIAKNQMMKHRDAGKNKRAQLPFSWTDENAV